MPPSSSSNFSTGSYRRLLVQFEYLLRKMNCIDRKVPAGIGAETGLLGTGSLNSSYKSSSIYSDITTFSHDILLDIHRLTAPAVPAFLRPVAGWVIGHGQRGRKCGDDAKWTGSRAWVPVVLHCTAVYSNTFKYASNSCMYLVPEVFDSSMFYNGNYRNFNDVQDHMDCIL